MLNIFYAFFVNLFHNLPNVIEIGEDSFLFKFKFVVYHFILLIQKIVDLLRI